MKISAGKIIRFTQTFYTSAHGEWGTVEQQVCYPDGLDPNIANALLNMTSGESTSVLLKQFEQFIRDDSLVIKVPISSLQGAPEVSIGMVFKANLSDRSLQGIVTSVEGDDATIDCNFPLFGLKNVTSNVHVIEVRDPVSSEEKVSFKPTSRTL